MRVLGAQMANETNRLEWEVDERRIRIMEILKQRGKIRVSELAGVFSISEATIRNDLNEMEKQRLLERIHGGAALLERGYHALPLTERMKTNEESKRRIAKVAAGFVQEGDSILISSGSTSLHVAMELRERRKLLVLTNSIPVASVLSGRIGIRVLLLGGFLHADEQFTYGDDAVRQLMRYRFDKLVYSGDGLCVSGGVTTWQLDEAEVSRHMFTNCQQCIVVADHTKIGRTCLAQVDDLGQVDRIITDTEVDEQEVRLFSERGIDVHQA